MWLVPRPTSLPSCVLIQPTIWPQYTNVRQTGQRSRIIGWTITCSGRPKKGQQKKTSRVNWYRLPLHTRWPSCCPTKALAELSTNSKLEKTTHCLLFFLDPPTREERDVAPRLAVYHNETNFKNLIKCWCPVLQLVRRHAEDTADD